MLIKGSVFKLILGGLFILGLSAAAAGVIYMLYVKPYAPINLDVGIRNNSSIEDCEPAIHFMDNSLNEDGFRMYRRKLGASAFTLINILPASPGILKWNTYIDSALPLGTYEYKVSAYNQFGENYGDIKQGTVVDSNSCKGITAKDPSTLPMNPVIVSLSIINDCNVRISFNDNSTNEQGFKIVRFTTNNGTATIATLGPHTGIPDTYDDKTNLAVGWWGYRIVAYNQKGNLVSNDMNIEVTSVCNPAMKFLPTTAALALPTLQKLSGGTCNWVAAVNVYLRKGPDAAVFDRLVLVSAGQGFPIVGQSQDGLYWAVQVGPGVVGYITKSETYSLANGDCSIVPPLKDPVPPVVAPTPTNNSGGKHKATSTPCPVGAVCP
jgi:hypothetical protein